MVWRNIVFYEGMSSELENIPQLKRDQERLRAQAANLSKLAEFCSITYGKARAGSNTFAAPDKNGKCRSSLQSNKL
ncbi:hypothetical protein TNCV_4769211 [Trichonephila clavipes]|nr:hypothetical protein TNCV_4769211 [Trichonephila clavipes]